MNRYIEVSWRFFIWSRHV